MQADRRARHRRAIEPADAALAIALVWVAGLAGLIGLLLHLQIALDMHGLWPIFAAASLLAWFAADGLLPPTASWARKLIVLLACLGLEALAVMPTAALGWELGGLPLVGGALAAALLGFIALLFHAIRKPTIDLQPVDFLVALAIVTGAASIVVIAFGLPLDFVIASCLLAPAGLLCLGHISEALYCTSAGEQALAGLKLGYWISALALQYLIGFIRLTH